MEPAENRLGLETSPYLRQHRLDPVDWYPWGGEALARAAELDRPLFLSIGYSACHWCHVMAHESFADEATAELMNETVVSVKVDREERPDVDSVYMEAVLTANGHGGWPMSVFATPDGRPFFTGTYFPRRENQGMPSFRQVLAAVQDIWLNRRDDVEAQADALQRSVAERVAAPPPLVGKADAARSSLEAVNAATRAACQRLGEMADPVHGGFGRAPKFPQPLLLDLLLRAHVSEVVPADGPAPLGVALDALEAMASGGIYDHLGGGFSRYSVDREFLVPHFEKMLYDQALLARVYLHAWQITGDERWRQVLDEVLGYVLSGLRHPSGALCSAEDADSEGEEGRFYVWTEDELGRVLSAEEFRAAVDWWGVSPGGNFEGRNILHRVTRGDLLRPELVESARRKLLSTRDERIRPGLDDKVLTEWNAMAVAVLAEAAGATSDERYRQAAEEIVSVLLGATTRNDGRVPRLAVRGLAAPGAEPAPGFAADVAWLAAACLSLFELTGEETYLAHATDLADDFVSAFVDPDSGVVFTTRVGAEQLVVRPTELYDGVIPSASSVAVGLLARLSRLTGDGRHADVASRIVSSLSRAMERAPATIPEMLSGATVLAGGGLEIAAVGSARDLLPAIRAGWLPYVVFASRAGDGVTGVASVPIALLDGRTDEAVYVCREGACRLPAHTVEEVTRELAAAMGNPRPGAR